MTSRRLLCAQGRKKQGASLVRGSGLSMDASSLRTGVIIAKSTSCLARTTASYARDVLVGSGYVNDS